MSKDSTGIGGAIRSMRKMRGLTQEALASRVGMVASSISNIESGMPSTTRTINKIANALGFEAHVTFRKMGDEEQIVVQLDDPRQMNIFDGVE